MERGLITGITRIPKESIFSELNHLIECALKDASGYEELAIGFGFLVDGKGIGP